MRLRTDSRLWGLTGSFAPDFSFPVEISEYTRLRAGLAFPRFRETPKWLKSRRRRKSDATFQTTENNGPGPPAHFGRIVEILKDAELRPEDSAHDFSRNLKVAQSSKSPKIERASQRSTDDRPGALANVSLTIEISKNTRLRAWLMFTRARKTSNRPKSRNRQSSGASLHRTRDDCPGVLANFRFPGGISKSRRTPSCVWGLALMGSRETLK